MEDEQQDVCLGPLTDIPENGMRQYELNGITVLVCRAGRQVHAVDGICPHRGAQLAGGDLTGNTVTCPWHDWEFDVETGCGTTNPMSSLKKYEIEIRNGDVYLLSPYR